MQNCSKIIELTVFILIFSVMLTLSVFASDHESEKLTAEDASNEMDKTIEAIESYSIGQKDKAVKELRAVLDDLDDSINMLEKRFDQARDEMDQKSREQIREYMMDIRKQRENLSEWYGGMKYGSLQTWDTVKKGFIDTSYQLKETFEAVREKL